MPEMAPPDGLTNIYFLEAIGTRRCKIGKANVISKRMRALQPWCAVELRLVAYMHAPPAEEYKLHRHFSDERQHGEWFVISPRLFRFITKTRRALGWPAWAVA